MDEDEEADAPRLIYRVLQAAFDGIEEVKGAICAGELLPDTVFACGEALGVIAKAKALVGRDIDDVTKDNRR